MLLERQIRQEKKYFTHTAFSTWFLSFVSLVTIIMSIASGTTATASQVSGIVLPASYEAEYQIKSSKYKVSVKADRKFDIEDLDANISQNASILFASIDQSSSFSFVENTCQIKSHSYQYKHSVLGKKKKYSLNFDYESNSFLEKKDSKKSTFPIKQTFYDELSYQEALRCELKNSKQLKIGEQFSYTVRTKGRSKDYVFEVIAFEKLETKLGSVDTVKLERIRSSKKDDEQSNIWFSEEHGFLLVKFTQQDDDDTYSLEILKLER